MRDKSYEYIACGLAVIFLMMLGLVAATTTPVVQAQGGLPDRATPTPDRDRGGDRDDGDSSGQKHPPGAYIELQQGPGGVWSVVQWQDSDGNWHAVEGWQGSLDGQGARRWWVAAKDFGTGPFRWLVFDAPGGSELGRSQPFHLPRFPNEILPVQLARTR